MLRLRSRYLAWLIVLLLLSVWPTDAVQMPAGMSGCSSLAECLKLLDSVASTAGPEMGPREEEIRGILKQFGEPAKHELLRRAAGNDRGWRRLADAILWGWESWTPSDVPELRSALLKDPGGWLGARLKIDFLKTDPSREAPISGYPVQCVLANDGTAPMLGILGSTLFPLSTFF